MFERSEWATDGWCRRCAAAAFVGEVGGSETSINGNPATKIPEEPSPMLIGCDAENIDDGVQAAGVVKLDGKPIPGVSLTLVPQEGVKGRGGYAVSSEDGSSSFQAAPEVQGVPAGYYRVLFQKYAMPDGSPIPPDTSAADAGIVNVLPPVYSHPEQSPVYLTFPTPDAQGITIDLKSRPR